MIETFFALDQLDTPRAFFAASAIGLAFGFFLERAGFGSSRKLTAIFYFRDMSVLKVMFTALLTAMLGLSYFQALGWIASDGVYQMPTVYGAQIIGGLLFGVGFVMGGWCPGTAAVGLASGKLDALLFLGGTILGSILFNELYPVIKGLYTLGASGVRSVHESLGLAKPTFELLFVLIAVACFWGSERIERRTSGGGAYFGSPFLKAFSLALVVLACGLFILPSAPPDARTASTREPIPAIAESSLMEAIERGEDHMEPEELAERLVAGDTSLLVVDVRTPAEFEQFHLPGAFNIPLSQLADSLQSYKNTGWIVLYSNGMTHPAQARDALARAGFSNVSILTDGLEGFLKRCLKPVSLRSEPVPKDYAARIQRWRSFFYRSPGISPAEAESGSGFEGVQLPGLVETQWLEERLNRPDVRIIDCRSQPDYNKGHLPGSLCFNLESFRGVVGGVPSVLLPADLLARHLALMQIRPTDTIVIVSGDSPRDATLIGMAFERLGHRRYALLSGGFNKWIAEGRAVNTELPALIESNYPLPGSRDDFTLDASGVLEFLKKEGVVILDVRPAEYYRGEKSDEARAGHIPGAKNRSYAEDVETKDEVTTFKPANQLAAAYAELIPSRESRVIVHCRTGHQASQTYFVLKRLLGYQNVYWYDAGWTEWATRPDLPVVK